MNITHETVGGLPLVRIADDTYHYSFGYYATNNWVDEHRLVLNRSPKFDGSDREFYANAESVLVDLQNETETLLVPHSNVAMVHGTKAYIIRRDEDMPTLVCVDIASGESRDLHRDKYLADSTVTADGRYYVYDGGDGSNCKRLDLQTGEAVELFRKRFQAPFPTANHFMVNPQNHRQVFFAHEGDTFYVSNRLWLYDEENGMHCMAKQRLDEEGNLGDCFGHECWVPDGSGLWFVKYPCSPLPPRGLCFAGVDGKQTNVQYAAYPYWHVCCAPNNRYLTADTQGPGYSSVVVIDKETGKEAEVYRAGFIWKHPAHPHPTFSPSSEQVIFHDLKDGQVTIGIVRVSDVF
ncbi:MAG: hypothetical protein E7552_04150 [Ruminococcaceae bacterium]|nr:hypothetical protein [Oscillospiraceae bacterium]